MSIVVEDYFDGTNIEDSKLEEWVEKCEKEIKGGKQVYRIASGNSAVVSFTFDNGKTIETIITKNYKERTLFSE